MKTRRPFAAILIVLAADMALAQEWTEIARVSPNPRAIVASPGGRFLGFSDNPDGSTTVFSVKPGAATRTQRLPWSPPFFAAGRDLRGERLCLPRRDSESSIIRCWDPDLRSSAIVTVPGAVESLAFTRDDELWIVPLEQPGAGGRLVEWRRGKDAVWRRSGRDFSVGVTGPGTRDILEIHPLDERTLAIHSVMGSFDGTRTVYPPAFVWSTASGPIRRIEPKAVTVSDALRRELSAFRGQSLRLAFRTAASGSRLAFVPVFSLPGENSVRHDEVWYRDLAGGDWQATRLPAQVSAVAVDGLQLFAATEDGRIWRFPGPRK